MRHLFRFRKLHRTPKQRKNLFRVMVANLILHKKMKTTYAKATELQRHANHVINLALRQKHQSPYITPEDRLIFKHISHVPAIHTLKMEIAPLFKNYPRSDYTLIEKLGKRQNDKAEMAHIYINRSSKYYMWIHSPEHKDSVERANRMKEYSLMLLNEEIAYFEAKRKEYCNLKSIAEAEKKPQEEIDKYAQWIAQVDRNIEETKIDLQTAEIRGERKSMKSKMKKLKSTLIASMQNANKSSAANSNSAHGVA